LDEFEIIKIKEDNIFYTSNIDQLIKKIQSIIDSNKNCVFHVSFDVDGLDPNNMSSTGTTAVDGLTPNDVIECVN